MTIISFETRDDLVSWVAGNTPVSGRAYQAGDFLYLGEVGATAISDLPDIVPFGDIYAEHFGLHADLAFTDTDPDPTKDSGYTRTTGTADNAAFQAADAYAISSGKGIFYCRSDVFLDGQINLSAHVHWKSGFRNYCWFRVAETESGFVIKDSNGGVSGVKIIIQHNTTTKQADRGHHGNAVTVGDFMATSPQTRVRDVHIDVRICRAAKVTGQNSYPSPMINLIGYVEHCTAKIGTFGHTNQPGSTFFQSHWGGYNASGDPTLEPTVSYHPNNNTIEIVGVVEQVKRALVLSSTFSMRISSFCTNRVTQPFIFLVGDNLGDYAAADHAGHVGLDNKVGFIRAANCELDNVQEAITAISQANPCVVTAIGHGLSTGTNVVITDVKGMTELNGFPYTITVIDDDTLSLNGCDSTSYSAYISGGFVGHAGSSDDCVLITARGTSKFATFPGSTKSLIKQIPIGLECEGFDIELTGSNISTTGVRVFGALGSINLGSVYCTGETKASVEIEYGNADVCVDVRKADMDVRYEFASGGSILGARVDKSASYNGTGDYCVQVIGDEATTVTTAAATAGDTSVAITAFPSDEVHIGDRLLIGEQPVIATAFVDSGVPSLTFTPIQADVPSGSTVVLDRRARLKKLIANYTGSEYGAKIDRATIDYADFSDVQWTGRNAARLSNKAIVRLAGDFPITTSRLITTSAYTFRVGVDCSLHLLPGVRIPANSDLTAHVQLQRAGASGPWGVMIAHGAVIEDVSNLFEATDGFQQARLLDCIDYDGRLIAHPDGQGSDTNGEWLKHADGTMEVWARNVTIGATQPFTWTFPGGGFSAVATVSVQVTPASATAARMGHGRSISETTAEVWAHNDDGSDAVNTGVNLYAKGYWR